MVDAIEKFPDKYIFMCMDGRNDSPMTGEVLYIAEREDELEKLRKNFVGRDYCGIFSGIDLIPTFGGIIAYAAD